MDRSKSFDVNLLVKEILVVIQWVEFLTELVIWRTVSLLERGVFLSSVEIRAHLTLEVSLREETIAWNPMILWSWLISPGVLEAVGIGVREIEWHVGITIVDSIKLFAFHELMNVVLDHRTLSHSSNLSSCCFSLDAVTESKDVLKSTMLKSIWVHINHA